MQKAQSYIDPTQALNLSASDRNPAKSTLFRHQFRLPDSQTPLQEITAELTISPPTTYAANVTQGEKDRDRDRGYHYVGKLHLSEAFLCFSTQPTSFLQTASTTTSSGFTGQTHGAGPGGNGFTLPLCAIRRVERLHSQSYQVSRRKQLRNSTCLIRCSLLSPSQHGMVSAPHRRPTRRNPLRNSRRSLYSLRAVDSSAKDSAMD